MFNFSNIFVKKYNIRILKCKNFAKRWKLQPKLLEINILNIFKLFFFLHYKTIEIIHCYSF